MTLLMREQEKYQMGMEKGLAKGRAEGRAEGELKLFLSWSETDYYRFQSAQCSWI